MKGEKPSKADPSPGANGREEDRLQKLESHLAFLERQYDELNKVVIAQSKTLARMQAELTRASDALRESEIERIRASNPKPPHYQ